MSRSIGENQHVEYAVVDVETTGLASWEDRILEIGIVTADGDGNPTGTWSTLIDPGRPVTATFIHGITDADIKSAPRFSEVLPQVVRLLAGRIIVGHNIPFDLAFMNAEFRRSDYPFLIPRQAAVCTMDQSRIYLPSGRHSLGACLERAGISLPVTHRAADDALCSAELLQYYLSAEKSGRRHAESDENRDGETVLPREWERAAGAARSLMWLEVADLPGL